MSLLCAVSKKEPTTRKQTSSHLPKQPRVICCQGRVVQAPVWKVIRIPLPCRKVHGNLQPMPLRLIVPIHRRSIESCEEFMAISVPFQSFRNASPCGHEPEYPPSPTVHLINAAPNTDTGTTHPRIPFRCIQRTHFLAHPRCSSSLPCFLPTGSCFNAEKLSPCECAGNMSCSGLGEPGRDDPADMLGEYIHFRDSDCWRR